MTKAVSGSEEAFPYWERGGDLCGPFVELVPVTGASISMFGTGRTHSTVSASDPLATRLDQLQLVLGEGPRWEVARTGKAVFAADLARDPDPGWAVFCANAAGLGVRALFTFPIAIGGVLIGAVDLYRLTPGALEKDEAARARSLTRMVAAPAAERAVLSVHDQVSPEHDGTPALRPEVDQATGMLLAQLDVTVVEALALLRAHAFAQGWTVDEVVSDVVARRLDFRDLRD